MWQNIKTRRETVRVAYEEIKQLRKDMVQEGESMDKNNSRVLSRESLEEVPKPRTAGTMLEKGNLFETNGWSIETQRRRRLPAEVWKQIESRWRSLEKGEIQGAVEKELTKDDVKMSDGSVDGLGGSLSS